MIPQFQNDVFLESPCLVQREKKSIFYPLVPRIKHNPGEREMNSLIQYTERLLVGK